MKCEEANQLFEAALALADSVERRRVMQHLSGCEHCRHAFRAVAYLRAERDRVVPEPSPGAVEEALRVAVARGRRRRAGSFWGGVAVGALAAGLGVLAVMLALIGGLAPPHAGAPEVLIALDEPKDLSIAIDAPEALPDAEIHVSLRGSVDLVGFSGQRDVRWNTSLERGVNQLKLPVRATGEQGGQVRVVVRHGGRQKTFLVDVHVAGANLVEPAASPSV